MIVLDENFPEDQRDLLANWGILARKIGDDVGRQGMGDDEIIPMLLTLSRPTLISVDSDFNKHSLCHAKYGIVHLGIPHPQAAQFARKVLRQSEFNSQAKRLGLVISASHVGLRVWRLNRPTQIILDWEG